MKAVVPEPNVKYFKSHFSYVCNILQECNVDISYSSNLFVKDCSFECLINGKSFLFDISDFEEILHRDKNSVIIKRTLLKPQKNVYPMGPLMGFYLRTSNPYKIYKDLLKERETNITPFKNYLYNQSIYGGAVKRRGNLAKHIKHERTNLTSKNYWKLAREHKYNIFLPGANTYVLDRAPAELMFMGATIMHPEIKVLFPHFKSLVPNVHYIQIADTGLDCLNNMNYQTGQEAKQFFTDMLPQNLFNWWTSI